jgi:hypothetical protein
LFGQSYFFGRIDHLAFEAVMIPERSWWNPAIQANMTGYVLQHEQIHFALTELAARKLTRDVHVWASETVVVKPTPQEVSLNWLDRSKRWSICDGGRLEAACGVRSDTSCSGPRRQQGGRGWWRTS